MPAKLESLGPRSADGPLRTAVAKAIILPLWGLRGIDQLESFGFWRRKFCIKNAEILFVGKIAEFAKFAGGKRRKFPDSCLFNRAKRVMDGRGLTGCRSVAEAARQSSDTALPIRASLLTAVLAEVLPGVLCVREGLREFEDLLAVFIFSPVRWV
jgi:hypothetical protein